MLKQARKIKVGNTGYAPGVLKEEEWDNLGQTGIITTRTVIAEKKREMLKTD